jgi:uncharacterized protein YodC (DUF2158 family)
MIDPKDLKPGDVVRLNVSAIKLSVHEVKGDRVACRWFVDNGEMVEGDFLPAQLVFVKAPEEA